MLGRTLTGRVPGVPLSPEGRAQAARLAEWVRGRPVAAVLSSPVQRAQETAAPIAAALGLPVLTEAGLDEVDFGIWAGAAFTDLDPLPDWRAWNAARSLAACPGGESMVDAQARALAGISRLHERYPGSEIVLVSHSDVLKSVLAHYLGVPLDLFQRITLDPASRSVVVLFDANVRVDGINFPV